MRDLEQHSVGGNMMGFLDAIGPGCLEKNVGKIVAKDERQHSVVIREGSHGSRYRIRFQGQPATGKYPLIWVTMIGDIRAEQVVGYAEIVGTESTLFILNRPEGEGELIFVLDDAKQSEMDRQLALLEGKPEGSC